MKGRRHRLSVTELQPPSLEIYVRRDDKFRVYYSIKPFGNKQAANNVIALRLKAGLQPFTVLFSFSVVFVCFIDAQIHSCF